MRHACFVPPRRPLETTYHICQCTVRITLVFSLMLVPTLIIILTINLALNIRPMYPPSHTLAHTHNSSSSSRSTSLAAVAEVCGRSTALAVAEVCGRRGTVVLDGPKNDATAAGMLAAIPAMRSMLVGVDVGWMCGWQVGCRVAGWMCGCPG